MTVKLAKRLPLAGNPGAAHAEWRLYELDPPMKNYDGDEEYTHVIVSASVVPYSGPETYIFGARKVDRSFAVDSFVELEGSYRGGLSHEAALDNAGYTVVP